MNFSWATELDPRGEQHHPVVGDRRYDEEPVTALAAVGKHFLRFWDRFGFLGYWTTCGSWRILFSLCDTPFRFQIQKTRVKFRRWIATILLRRIIMYGYSDGSGFWLILTEGKSLVCVFSIPFNVSVSYWLVFCDFHFDLIAFCIGFLASHAPGRSLMYAT